MKKTFVAALCLLAIGLAVVMIRTDWMNDVMKLGRKENTPVYYTFNEIDGGYFLDAVKAMSDSSYSGLDLANRLYVHAFSQSVLTNNEITDTALTDLANAAKPTLLDMVAPGLYGGNSMPGKIAGVKGESAGRVMEKDLINGDVLLTDGKVYAYADGLWLLEKGATKANTAAVLESLSRADQYAVLRPSMVQ